MTSIIGERYELKDAIGRGGMGTVYHGVDRQTGTTVAIKQLHPDRADDEQIARFQREGAALRDLDHPNIVKMLDAFQDTGHYYLVMEYVTGGDLKHMIQDQPLSPDDVIRMGIDLADALTRAHKLGIVHRDLKPANVLIAEDGTLQLTDFGIAHVRHQDTISNDDAIMGTIDYLAPEMLGGENITERVDIWAFGVMLFEMLTGQNPFARETVVETISAISFDAIPDLNDYDSTLSADLQDLVYRMLERDVHSRISSVRYVGAILEDIQQGRTTNTSYKTRFQTDTQNFAVPKRNNLPEQLTEFVGRETEIAEIQHLLDTPSIRLITILAHGGMGKTRLALEVARRNLSNYNDGVYFVELAPIAQIEKIISAIADALDIQIRSADPKNEVIQFLRDKTLLLVIDNWEHVIDGASIVTEILKDAPNVKMVNTSRLRLGQMGETLVHLAGMEFPHWETPDDAMEYAAVKLFLNSAKRAQPDFELTTDNLDYVARICRLVQGMPLGILLAAAWVSMLSPTEIAEELQNGMDLLVDDSGELPERQQSIRLVMDYAWQAMTEAEQAVFAKLSLFKGGFTREAAQQIADANLRVLMSLTNKSLIRRDNDTGRYQIHELLRQFGQEQFEQSADADTTHDAHRDYYAAFVSERLSPLKGSLRQMDVAREIKQELENIQLAWIRASQTERYDQLQNMIECLHLTFHDFGAAYDGVTFYETVLPYLSDESSELQQLINAAYATVLADTSQMQAAIALVDDVLAYTQSHDVSLLLQFLARGVRAYLHMYAGEFAKAKQLTDEAAQLADEMNDPYYQALMYQSQAVVISFSGGQHQEEMKQLLTKALDLAVASNNLNTQGSIRNNIEAVTTAMGDWDEAEVIIRTLLEASKAANYQPGYLLTINKLSRLEYIKGNFDTAQSLIEECLSLAGELRNLPTLFLSSRTKMKIAIAQGNYDSAKNLAEQAMENARRFGVRNYISELEMYQMVVPFYEMNKLSDTVAMKRYLSYKVDEYRLESRLEGVIISAWLQAHSENYQDATAYLATVLKHPKCAPVFKNHYAPIESLRERLQTVLSPAEFDAAWQRGAELDFDALVSQLKDAYSNA